MKVTLLKNSVLLDHESVDVSGWKLKKIQRLLNLIMLIIMRDLVYIFVTSTWRRYRTRL